MKIKLSDEEKSHLEQYCTRVGRTKTDVLRELIRGLPGESSGWGDVDPEENLLEVLPEGWVQEKGVVFGTHKNAKFHFFLEDLSKGYVNVFFYDLAGWKLCERKFEVMTLSEAIGKIQAL